MPLEVAPESTVFREEPPRACALSPWDFRSGGGLKTIDFRTLFQALPSPYMVLDRDLGFVEVNAAYEAAIFRDRDDLIGGYVFDLFPDAENGELPRPCASRRIRRGSARCSRPG